MNTKLSALGIHSERITLEELQTEIRVHPSWLRFFCQLGPIFMPKARCRVKTHLFWLRRTGNWSIEFEGHLTSFFLSFFVWELLYVVFLFDICGFLAIVWFGNMIMKMPFQWTGRCWLYEVCWSPSFSELNLFQYVISSCVVQWIQRPSVGCWTWSRGHGSIVAQ